MSRRTFSIVGCLIGDVTWWAPTLVFFSGPERQSPDGAQKGHNSTSRHARKTGWGPDPTWKAVGGASCFFRIYQKRGHGTPPVDPSPAHSFCLRSSLRSKAGTRTSRRRACTGGPGGLSVRHRRVEVQKIKAEELNLELFEEFWRQMSARIGIRGL